MELFVADAATGKVLRRLSSNATDPHFDSLEFLNSAGAWSPDGRILAMAAIHDGKPVVALLDARSGTCDARDRAARSGRCAEPGVLAGRRDGSSFSGNRGGLMDLYRVSVTHGQAGTLEQLTDDPFADLEPVFLPDGTGLVFVTERYSTNLDSLAAGPLRLARLDWRHETGDADSGIPQGQAPEPAGERSTGASMTFIADPDGISNLYRIRDRRRPDRAG